MATAAAAAPSQEPSAISSQAPGAEGKAPAQDLDVRTLGVGMMFPGDSPITSMDFHGNGEHLVTASEDGTITLINSLDGKWKKKVFSRKYGVELVCFTHHDFCVLCTSRPTTTTTTDPSAYDIRYLCLYTNTFIRFFTGHTARVTSLAMSPCNDRFLSGSADGTVRLWDLQFPKCLAVASLSDKAVNPLVAWDPSGLVFGVSAGFENKTVIKLYSLEEFKAGAFATAWVDGPKIIHYLENVARKNIDPELRRRLFQAYSTGMEFSADGVYLLLVTNVNLVILLDAFELTIKAAITDYVNNTGQCNACFTLDGDHVVVASEDHQVHVFDTQGQIVNRLKGHPGPVTRVACNPKYEVVASACSNTILWLPQQEEITTQP